MKVEENQKPRTNIINKQTVCLNSPTFSLFICFGFWPITTISYKCYQYLTKNSKVRIKKKNSLKTKSNHICIISEYLIAHIYSIFSFRLVYIFSCCHHKYVSLPKIDWNFHLTLIGRTRCCSCKYLLFLAQIMKFYYINLQNCQNLQYKAVFELFNFYNKPYS